VKKKLIYLVMLVISISFSSFRGQCNDDNDETSFKDNWPKKINPVITGKDWNLSPIYNLLDI
jgi:hypothetical protein